MFMSDVELNSKQIKRILSICSDYFGNRPMDAFDIKVIRKLEVMLDAELEYENDY